MSAPAPALVVSSRADRRHAWARQWLRRQPAGFLILGPSRSAVDDFLRGFAREGARGDRGPEGAVAARTAGAVAAWPAGAFGAHRYTLAQLAWQEASPHLADRSLARLTPLGSEAMAALAVDRAAGRLRTLGAVATLPGFPRALSATLFELRMASVEPGQLASLGGPCPDLGSLLEAYLEALDQWSLADSALVFERAAHSLAQRRELRQELRQNVRQQDRPGRGLVGSARGRELDWRGAPTLCLDLPIGAPLEVELLRSLFSLQEQVAFTASRGDDRSIELGAELLEVAPRDLDREIEPRDELERVQRYVFAPEVPRPREPAEAPGAGRSASAGSQGPIREQAPVAATFDLFSAAGEGQECVEIARRVRNLAAEGVAFDRMAIFVRQPTAYLPLIEDALRRARIPIYLSRGASRPDPSGRAFLALLACAVEGLSASRFAEYLSLGQVPVLEPDATPPVREVPWVEPTGDQLVLMTPAPNGEDSSERADEDPAENVRGVEASTDGDSRELASPAVAGSLPTPAHWERLLVDAAVVGGADRWRRRLDGLDAELRRRAREVGDEEELRKLGIERDLGRLGLLRAFALPLIEMLEALPASARWGGWIDRLEEIATRSLRRPRSVLGLLADLRPLREVGPVPLAQVQRVLEERLGTLRRKPGRRRFGQVFVGTLEEAAGRCFDVVFVPGLAEGVFPRRSSEDPLLLDDFRGRLECGLVEQEGRQHAERLLLHLALGAAVERAVVSYPRVDIALGRARVPSFYALDVLRACEGSVPDLKSLALRAAASGSTLQQGDQGDQGSGPVLEQAIDDAEYDLALLQDLFRRAPGEAVGEGRFLLTFNDSLRRSLHARARRWRRKWTYADGLVATPGLESSRIAIEDFGSEGVDRETMPSMGSVAKEGGEDPASEDQTCEQRAIEVRALLDAESPRRRSFSPTALQHFSACPYRFFLQAILRLRPREDRAGFEQLDPLTRGSLFHQVQFELHGELSDAGLLPATQGNAGEVLEVADRVFERLAAQFTEDLAPAIPRVWQSELESLRNDLRGWLRQVAEESAPWSPLHFELAFGLAKSDERDPRSEERPVAIAGGRKARGAIDLVEIDRAGRRLRVTDHKTGRPRRERGLVIAGGSVLQPLIYALAAEQLLASPSATPSKMDGATNGARGDERPADGAPDRTSERASETDLRVVSGRLYYCTQRGEYSSLEVPLNPEGRRAVEQVYGELEAALKEGFLPAAPQTDACRWCDYRPVCGPYEERRVGRKDPSRLQALGRLRRHR